MHRCKNRQYKTQQSLQQSNKRSERMEASDVIDSGHGVFPRLWCSGSDHHCLKD